MKFFLSISLLIFIACNDSKPLSDDSIPEETTVKTASKSLYNAFQITPHDKAGFEGKGKMIRTCDIKYRGDKKRISVYGEQWEKNEMKQRIPVFSMDLEPEKEYEIQVGFNLLTAEKGDDKISLKFSGTVTSQDGTVASQVSEIETTKPIGTHKKFVGGGEKSSSYGLRNDNNEFMIWGYGIGSEFSFHAPTRMDINQQKVNTADISFLGIVKFE